MIRVESSVVLDIILCSLLIVNHSSVGTCRLHLQGRRTSGARNDEDYCECDPETSVDFQRTTRRYIPGVIAFHR
jgi:hypothetical protein